MTPPTQDDLAVGRELDAVVAEKVMGWTFAHTEDEYDPRTPGSLTLVGVTPDKHRLSVVPAYSSDIGAAWQIIEFMRGQGLRPVLMPDWGKQWQCVVYRQDQYVCQSEWFDSAPLAICRAALAAVSAQP